VRRICNDLFSFIPKYRRHSLSLVEIREPSAPLKMCNSGGMMEAPRFKCGENRSVQVSSSFPRTCSGDMEAMVPNALPGLVRCSSDSMVGALIPRLSGLSVTFASPKSRIFV
jgi:hypothetical protein